MPAASKFGALPGRAVQKRPTAFLTVQEGCDKFCTYCVVPYTRGAEISRPWAAIMDEAKALIDGGVSEITLLGQNVNAWPGEDEAGRPQGLDGLIRALDGFGVRPAEPRVGKERGRTGSARGSPYHDTKNKLETPEPPTRKDPTE